MGWERRRDMRDMMGDGLVVAAWEVCVVAVVAVQLFFSPLRPLPAANEAYPQLPPPK